MRQRLQKVLSQAGIASRRAAEGMIEEGRVSVDGKVIKELGSLADPDLQDIRVDGSRVRTHRPRRYVALHKPPGYVTTRNDPGRRPTVMELLPQAYRSLFPVGRLDMASTGLLVLTDDGELAQRLMHPRYQVPKTYLATVLGSPEAAVLERAQRGIVVQGERLSADRIVLIPSRDATRTKLRVTLRQGRNREIRRLFGALGHAVVALHRERVGTLSVRGLRPGAFRSLTPGEVKALKTGTDLSRRERPARRTRVK